MLLVVGLCAVNCTRDNGDGTRSPVVEGPKSRAQERSREAMEDRQAMVNTDRVNPPEPMSDGEMDRAKTRMGVGVAGSATTDAGVPRGAVEAAMDDNRAGVGDGTGTVEDAMDASVRQAPLRPNRR